MTDRLQLHERFAPMKERSDAENWGGEKRVLVNVARDAIADRDRLAALNAGLLAALERIARYPSPAHDCDGTTAGNIARQMKGEAEAAVAAAKVRT